MPRSRTSTADKPRRKRRRLTPAPPPKPKAVVSPAIPQPAPAPSQAATVARQPAAAERPMPARGDAYDPTKKGDQLQRTRAMLVRNFAGRQGKRCISLLASIMDNEAADLRVRMQAAIALLDRGFGKASQEVQHTGEGGGPIRAVIELPPNYRTGPMPVAMLSDRSIDAESMELPPSQEPRVIEGVYSRGDDLFEDEDSSPDMDLETA